MGLGEGLDGAVHITGLHQGLSQQEVGLTIFGGDLYQFLEGGGSGCEFFILELGGTLAHIHVGDEVVCLCKDIFLNVFGSGGLGFFQGCDGLVVCGFVDLFLGDGKQGAGDSRLAGADELCGILFFRAFDSNLQSGTELGQGLSLVGIHSLDAIVESFFGIVEALCTGHGGRKGQGRKNSKKFFHLLLI